MITALSEPFAHTCQRISNMNKVTVVATIAIFFYGDFHFRLVETQPVASPNGLWWNQPRLAMPAPSATNSQPTSPTGSSLAAIQPPMLVANSVVPSSDNNTATTQPSTFFAGSTPSSGNDTATTQPSMLVASLASSSDNSLGQSATGTDVKLTVIFNHAPANDMIDHLANGNDSHDTTENLTHFGTEDGTGGYSYDVVNAPPWGQELTPAEDHNPPYLMDVNPGPPDDVEANY